MTEPHLYFRGAAVKFEVYCDEAHQDVLTSKQPRARYLMIGSLWVPQALRDELKTRISVLRKHHSVWGEIKWSKVSPSRKDFYMDLIDLFVSYEHNLRFRCIAVDRTQVNPLLHTDSELGFYKFYYQLLHQWILYSNVYRIFCDAKSNRDRKRLSVLARCLSKANVGSRIESVQSLSSHEVVLIQFCDLLLGVASSRLNETLQEGTIKCALVQRLEAALERPLVPTYRTEGKFNIFKIQLQGGW